MYMYMYMYTRNTTIVGGILHDRWPALPLWQLSPETHTSYRTTGLPEHSECHNRLQREVGEKGEGEGEEVRGCDNS